MEKMKERVQDILIELLKNAKKSDRDIAKKLNISQPTVTRIRKKLEKNIISSYTAVPILSEIGINLISFNFGTCEDPKKDIEICLRQISKSDPKITFTTTGGGMGKNCLIIAFHKNYRDYIGFLTNIRSQCKGTKTHFDSFLSATSKQDFLNFGVPVANLIKRKK